ncbi:transposase [Halodurantibacterium flavum]|uniref:Transposase n=1 Tax=Halodurantibacterium flavum TaxID=1382802 RepID=A0ABW4S6L7_9RHOB
MVEAHIDETLHYYSFPDSHWLKIRTNNPLERIMREIRRRTRVVGHSPTVSAASTSPQHACATSRPASGRRPNT